MAVYPNILVSPELEPANMFMLDKVNTTLNLYRYFGELASISLYITTGVTDEIYRVLGVIICKSYEVYYLFEGGVLVFAQRVNYDTRLSRTSKIKRNVERKHNVFYGKKVFRRYITSVTTKYAGSVYVETECDVTKDSRKMSQRERVLSAFIIEKYVSQLDCVFAYCPYTSSFTILCEKGLVVIDLKSLFLITNESVDTSRITDLTVKKIDDIPPTIEDITVNEKIVKLEIAPELII